MKAWTVQSNYEGITYYAFVHDYSKEDVPKVVVCILGAELEFSDVKEFALRLARREDAEALAKVMQVGNAICKEETFDD